LVRDSREAVEAGAFMSYAYDIVDHSRRLASYVDRILQGAKPADLPVQQAVEVRADHQPEDGQALGSRSRRRSSSWADEVIK